jgi:hypothetical protein
VAAAAAILASLPQIHPRLVWGATWNNTFVSYYFDEPAYLVYLQGLIDGLPRRSDPYAGFDHAKQTAQSESLFSIQFLPAYTLAIPARLLGLTSTEIFVALRTVSAFLSALAIFCLLQVFTKNLKIVAVGTLIIFCLGCYVSSAKPVSTLFALGYAGYDFPFLRCFLPALPFPVFFFFCAAVLKAMVSMNRARILLFALLGGIAFVVLLFSYFFLWTAAAAWLACLAFVLVLSPSLNVRRLLGVLGVILPIALCGMIPYVLLLLQRSPTMDVAQLLLKSHAPDFSHRSEYIAGALIIIFVVAVKRRAIDWSDSLNRTILAFALLPFCLFNQQVITGYSLQPFHYEVYVAPYSVAIAGVLLATMFGRQLLRRHASYRTRAVILLSCLAVLVVGRAVATTVIMSNTNMKSQATTAGKFAVLKRFQQVTLEEENKTRDSRPVVFFTDLEQADMAPALAPYFVLWAPHMFVFPGLTESENKERLYRYLYFQGVTREEFAVMASKNSYLSLALFGFERASRGDFSEKGIRFEDVAREQENYNRFVASFDLSHALVPKIDYVVTQSQRGPNLSNFDRWYERYDAYSVGDFTMWRVKPRI